MVIKQNRYRKLKLMAEVQCWAVWDVSGLSDDIDPSKLPLSRQLIEDLNSWSERLDATYKLDDPNFHLEAGFKLGEEDQFYDDGWELFERLKNEMPETEWSYRDHRYQSLLFEKPSA